MRIKDHIDNIIWILSLRISWYVKYHLLVKQFSRLWRALPSPICWLRGHDTYEDNGHWGGARKCMRCSFEEPLWFPKKSSSIIPPGMP